MQLSPRPRLISGRLRRSDLAFVLRSVLAQGCDFCKLRLSGFKSFVEPTDFVIEPGLTGVVGPNGCGKSNLVEALRWVMGENSHKNMRASGMDDVIFSGNNGRPSRNHAEVALCSTM